MAELAEVGRMNEDGDVPAIDDKDEDVVPLPVPTETATAAAAADRFELERDSGMEPVTAVRLPRLRRLLAW